MDVELHAANRALHRFRGPIMANFDTLTDRQFDALTDDAFDVFQSGPALVFDTLSDADFDALTDLDFDALTSVQYVPALIESVSIVVEEAQEQPGGFVDYWESWAT